MKNYTALRSYTILVKRQHDGEFKRRFNFNFVTFAVWEEKGKDIFALLNA